MTFGNNSWEQMSDEVAVLLSLQGLQRLMFGFKSHALRHRKTVEISTVFCFFRAVFWVEEVITFDYTF